MRSIQFLSFILSICLAVPVFSLEWGELEGQIKSAIEESKLGGHSIETSYRRGVLTLSGYVSNEADKARVEKALSSVHGITEVKSELIIKQSGMPKDENGQERKAVLDAVRKLRGLGNYELEVRPGLDAQIHLVGSAATEADKIKIESTAKSVLGERHFVSEIKVVETPSDAVLETRIQEALAKEEGINLGSVTYSVKAGVADFQGTINSHRAIDRVLSIANMVEGVKEVKSSVKIGRE